MDEPAHETDEIPEDTVISAEYTAPLTGEKCRIEGYEHMGTGTDHVMFFDGPVGIEPVRFLMLPFASFERLEGARIPRQEYEVRFQAPVVNNPIVEVLRAKEHLGCVVASYLTAGYDINAQLPRLHEMEEYVNRLICDPEAVVDHARIDAIMGLDDGPKGKAAQKKEEYS